MATLETQFISERGLLAARAKVSGMIKGLTVQAEAAFLSRSANDEVIRKLDDAIRFLGNIAQCKIVIVTPENAERALNTLERSGHTEAINGLAIEDSPSVLAVQNDNSPVPCNNSLVVAEPDALAAGGKHVWNIQEETATDNSSFTFPSLAVPTLSPASSSLSWHRRDQPPRNASNATAVPNEPSRSGVPSIVAIRLPSLSLVRPALRPKVPVVFGGPTSATESVVEFGASSPPQSSICTSSSMISLCTWSSSSDSVSGESTASETTLHTPSSSSFPRSPSIASSDDACTEVGPTAHISNKASHGIGLISFKSQESKIVTVREKFCPGSSKSLLQPEAWRIPDRTKHFSQQHPAPPCNRHYLLATGCQDGKCGYRHDFLLTEADVSQLRYDSKKSPCAHLMRGRKCPQGPEKCHMGHSCPYGDHCRYGDACKFTLHNMHDAPAILPDPRTRQELQREHRQVSGSPRHIRKHVCRR